MKSYTRMHDEEIHGRLVDAIKCFCLQETELLELNVNERTISSTLGCYLQALFPDWNVDCEYNRFGEERVKKLFIASKENFLKVKSISRIPPRYETFEEWIEREEGISIFPDIIVHQRKQQNNLLVVEIKKSNYTEAAGCWDEIKIDYMLNSFEYAVGAFLVLNTGSSYKSSELNISPNSYLQFRSDYPSKTQLMHST